MPVSELSLSHQPTPHQLQLRWGIAALASAGMLAAGYAFAPQLWPSPSPIRWVGLSALAYLYFLTGLWRNLAQNHRPDETALLPTFGWGNTLSIVRGLLMMALVGFLFQPQPGSGSLSDWRAWVPGLLYTAAALPDYVDGYFARLTNHVTKLGEWLDMTLDSVGVLTATLLAVQYGTVPWWYLPVGLARYLFLAGIWIRQKRNLPIHDMPYSVRRRGFAALKMGFMFVMLFPAFGPPGTYWGAAAFGLPFALGFLWDWFYVSGTIPAEAGNWYPRLKHFILKNVPLLLRGVTVALVIPQIQRHLVDGLFLLAFLEITITTCLALGIAPRTIAIAGAVIMGVNQNIAPLSIDQLTLLVTYISMIFLGSGLYSLWPFEEYLIHHRPGDPLERHPSNPS